MRHRPGQLKKIWNKIVNNYVTIPEPSADWFHEGSTNKESHPLISFMVVPLIRTSRPLLSCTAESTKER